MARWVRLRCAAPALLRAVPCLLNGPTPPPHQCLPLTLTLPLAPDPDPDPDPAPAPTPAPAPAVLSRDTTLPPLPPAGACLDSVALVQQALTGRTTLHPLLLGGAEKMRLADSYGRLLVRRLARALGLGLGLGPRGRRCGPPTRVHPPPPGRPPGAADAI